MSGQLNYLNIFLYGLLLAIIVLAICYFFDLFGLKAFVSGLAARINLPNIQLPDLGGIFSWIQANPLATTICGFLGTTAVGYIIKNWQTGKTVDKLTEEVALAKNDLSAQSIADAKKITSLEAQVKSFTEDTIASELQKRISAFSDEKLQWDAKFQSLQAQNQELMNKLANTPVKIVEVVK